MPIHIYWTMINESSFVGKQIRMQGILETSNILSLCLSMLWLQYNPSLNRQNLEYLTTHLTHPLPAISIFTIDLGTMRRHPPQMHINKPSLQFWASRTSIKVFTTPHMEVWSNWIYAIHFTAFHYFTLIYTNCALSNWYIQSMLYPLIWQYSASQLQRIYWT